jgi:hypothetical protein
MNNIPNGFELNLKPYCAYCGEFESEIVKLDVSSLSEPNRYLTTIYCRNQDKCADLAERMKNAVKGDDSTGAD